MNIFDSPRTLWKHRVRHTAGVGGKHWDRLTDPGPAVVSALGRRDRGRLVVCPVSAPEKRAL
jgi:hypothetical protein